MFPALILSLVLSWLFLKCFDKIELNKCKRQTGPHMNDTIINKNG